MVAISWTREAELWLKDIYDYIAEDDPTAALKVVQEIVEKAKTLADFPQLGQRYEGASDRDVRILLQSHYRIAYLVKESGDVDILGVFHGALDIKRYLL